MKKLCGQGRKGNLQTESYTENQKWKTSCGQGRKSCL